MSLCQQSGLQIAKMWVTWSTPEPSLSPILEFPFIWAELPSWNCHWCDIFLKYEITMQGFAINLSSQDSYFRLFVYLYFQPNDTNFLKVYLANKNSSEATTSGLSLSFSFFPFSPRSPVPVKASIEHQVLRESSIVFYNSFDILLISESP